MTTITVENFADFFNLDYAFALTDGVSNIDEDSACVGKLISWCSERGYEVSRDIACEVLEEQAECRTQMGS